MSVSPWCTSCPDAPVTWCPVSVSASSSCSSVLMTSCRDQVDEGEDDDPDDVDEVPVEADQLDDLGLAAGDAVGPNHQRQRQQHDDADRHVHAVESRQRVEA